MKSQSQNWDLYFQSFPMKIKDRETLLDEKQIATSLDLFLKFVFPCQI